MLVMLLQKRNLDMHTKTKETINGNNDLPDRGSQHVEMLFC